MNGFEKIRSVLDFPAAYRFFIGLVGGGVYRIYLREYVRLVPGDKVLDVGCGPGDILNYLPETDYTGFDVSPEYIAAARKRFGSRGRFFCEDVGLASLERERGTFSRVLATGVIHHLDDCQAGKLFELARLALRPGGYLATFDGCYVPGQSAFARWMLSHDRGRFVRTQEEYVRLAAAWFPRVEVNVRHDLLRIPYTHLIMRCYNG